MVTTNHILPCSIFWNILEHHRGLHSILGSSRTKMVQLAPSWCNKNMDGARGIKCGTRASRLEQHHHLSATITCMAQQVHAWHINILHGATRVLHGIKGIPHGARGSILLQERVPLAQQHPSWPKSSADGATRSPCCSISLPNAPNLFQVLQTPFFMICSFGT